MILSSSKAFNQIQSQNGVGVCCCFPKYATCEVEHVLDSGTGVTHLIFRDIKMQTHLCVHLMVMQENGFIYNSFQSETKTQGQGSVLGLT